MPKNSICFLCLHFSEFDMGQKNIVLQQFSEKERKHLSEEKDGSNQQLAPDESCVGYLPIIQRGMDYSPYYMTSGRNLTLLFRVGVNITHISSI